METGTDEGQGEPRAVAERRYGPGFGVAALIAALVSLVFGPLIAVVALVLAFLSFRGGSRRLAYTAAALALFGIAIRIVFLVGFDGKPYRVPSGAMIPTIRPGERVLTVGESDPSRGEIVVFDAPSAANGFSKCRREPRAACEVPAEGSSGVDFIKRVVAVAGDEVSFEDGGVIVNGERVEGPACEDPRPSVPCDLPKPITIPEGTVFVVGDNLAASDDSRIWGPLPVENVHHRALFVYWPLDAFGSVG